jgi:hypothetical protein
MDRPLSALLQKYWFCAASFQWKKETQRRIRVAIKFPDYSNEIEQTWPAPKEELQDGEPDLLPG